MDPPQVQVPQHLIPLQRQLEQEGPQRTTVPQLENLSSWLDRMARGMESVDFAYLWEEGYWKYTRRYDGHEWLKLE